LSILSQLILIVAGIFFLHAGYCIGKRARRVRKKLLKIVLLLGVAVLVVIGAPLIASGTGLLWYTHRPRPDNTRQILFEGITYTRDVRSEPRPVIIHLITVDLAAPGVRFLVTPGEPIEGRQMPARTTSQFLKKFGVQVAINGDCLDPCRSDGIWDYYPHTGDPVNVLGNAASRGQVYSAGRRTDLTLYISRDNQARIGKPIGEVYNALSGTHCILERGRIARDLPGTIHPRTAVALDRQAGRLFLVVVDGRQPNYSVGVTLEELARIVLEYGGDTALNLDGGGSSALVIERKPGNAVRLNSPVHTRIPGRERPVANHLGIYARERKLKTENLPAVPYRGLRTEN